MIGYKNNVEFIDSRMQDVLQTIIDKSEIPPIIIVMGDHGPRGNYLNPEHRMAILNVYYVDEETQKSLYGSISPVNTFRVILNHYFGEDYPLIEDVSFFANKYDDISEYILVPNNCTGK